MRNQNIPRWLQDESSRVPRLLQKESMSPRDGISEFLVNQLA